MTGAPDSTCIDWSPADLTAQLDVRSQRYLGTVNNNHSDATTVTQTQSQALYPLAKWRHVPLTNGKLEVKPPVPKQERAQFTSFDGAEELEHVKFLEHSLAILQDLESSQIEPPEQTLYGETMYLTNASYDTDISIGTSFQTTESISTNDSGQPEQQVITFAGPITDLKSIPSARHLQAIHPQTMTINIIASVISVRPTRTVRLRKRDGEMNIIEVLLGDETRAGFTISFWLPTVDSQAPSSSKFTLRETLAELRTGNVLLVTHVALSEFNGNVYGQSLSKRITRNNTSVVVLSESAVGLPAPSMSKLERVRLWSDNFVGGKKSKRAAETALDNALNRKRRMMLPPDTQPKEL